MARMSGQKEKEDKGEQGLSLFSSLTRVWREGRGDWGPKLTSLENSVIFTNGFYLLLSCTLCTQLHFTQAV